MQGAAGRAALAVGGRELPGQDAEAWGEALRRAEFFRRLGQGQEWAKEVQVFGVVTNLFDRKFATYGTFFDTAAVPNFANGGAPFTDPRSLSPARPRAFYAGLKAVF